MQAMKPHAADVPSYSGVSAGVQLERARLQHLFSDVYRPDGSIDTQALARFARALNAQGADPRAGTHERQCA